MKHIHIALPFLVLATTACPGGGGNGGGCAPDINVEDVDPREDVPASLVEKSDGEMVWVTRWDNPPVTGLAELEQDQAAQRDANQWLFTNVDLAVTIEPGIANPGQFSPFQNTRAVSAWPTLEGSFDPGSSIFWEAHGLRLQPRRTGAEYEAIASVQALRADEFPGAGDTEDFVRPILYDNYADHKNPGLFQLDPDVALVPLKVIVLYVPGHPQFGANWMSSRYTNSLFDDAWTENKQVAGGWTADGRFQYGCDDCGGPNNESPDRIWDECGVQFRAVKYHQCPVSEFVFDSVHGNLPMMNGACDLVGMHNSVVDAVTDCVDIDDGLTAVVFKGNISGGHISCDSSGSPLGYYPNFNGGFPWAYLRRFGGDRLVAHELGHALGLPDNACALPHTLMCSTDPGPTIGACNTPRTTARNKQNAYWP